MEWKYVVIETRKGNRIAIVNELEDGRDLDVAYLLRYSDVEKLNRVVRRMRKKDGVDGITKTMIGKLVGMKLLTPPDAI